MWLKEAPDENSGDWCPLPKKCIQTAAYMLYITLNTDILQVLLNIRDTHNS